MTDSTPAPPFPPSPSDAAPASPATTPVDPAAAGPAEVAAAAAVLRRGGLVAMPTETVYGLGADASDPEAVARVFAAKGRPADHPLIVHLASAAQIDEWAVDVPAVAREVAARFWPGPLTLILRRHPRVPTAVTGGQDTIGLRVPSHPVAHALLEAFGGGVAAPSANRFGRVSPTTAERVVAELGDRVDVVLEGGACEVGLESTILDLSGEHPRLLRPGAIGVDALAEVLGETPTRTVRGGPRTPGRLPSHYAPTTPVRVLDRAVLRHAVAAHTGAGRRVAVLALSADVPQGSAAVAMPADPVDYGRELYGHLAAVDGLGCDVALVERPPAEPGWEAVHDRLGRSEGVDPHTPRAVVAVEGLAVLATARDDLARALAPEDGAPALPLAVWVADPAVLADADALRPATGRTLRLGDVVRGDGWVVRRIEASDANLGIPATRVEVLDGLASPEAPESGTTTSPTPAAGPAGFADVGDPVRDGRPAASGAFVPLLPADADPADATAEVAALRERHPAVVGEALTYEPHGRIVVRP